MSWLRKLWAALPIVRIFRRRLFCIVLRNGVELYVECDTLHCVREDADLVRITWVGATRVPDYLDLRQVVAVHLVNA